MDYEDNYDNFDNGDYEDETPDHDYQYEEDLKEDDKDSSVDDNESKKDINENEDEDENVIVDENVIDSNIIATKVSVANKYITGKNRRFNILMTIYEYTRLIGACADKLDTNLSVDPIITQICNDLNKDKPVESHICDSLEIAEIMLNTLNVEFPIKLLRPTKNNEYELWDVRELILPHNAVELDLKTYNEYRTKFYR
jgi:hypothetical protein